MVYSSGYKIHNCHPVFEDRIRVVVWRGIKRSKKHLVDIQDAFFMEFHLAVFNSAPVRTVIVTIVLFFIVLVILVTVSPENRLPTSAGVSVRRTVLCRWISVCGGGLR